MLASLIAMPQALSVAAQNAQEAAEAYKRGDYAAALKLLLPQAAQGNAEAQNNLGLMYYRGEGVPQDREEAVSWFRMAAEKGHSSAQYNLGLTYHKGAGVPQDSAEALKWFRKAAAQGDAGAQNSLRFGRKSSEEVTPESPLLSKPAPTRGELRVQFAAFKSEDRAATEARRLNGVHETILGGRKIVSDRADLGERGVFYRLRAGPFNDRAFAQLFCRKFFAQKRGCVVVSP